MSIARVASNTYTGNGGSASFNAGASDLVIAAVYRNNAGTITNPQWNGVSMTTRYSASLPSTNNVYIFFIQGGATGTNDFTYTGTNAEIVLVSYSGVSSSGFPDASVSITPATLSGTQTATLTTVADNAWQTLFYFSADAVTVTPGSGSTFIASANSAGVGTHAYDSNAALTPAGSKSMAISLSAGSRSSVHSFSFAPAGGGGGGSPTPLLSLMGVGS